MARERLVNEDIVEINGVVNGCRRAIGAGGGVGGCDNEIGVSVAVFEAVDAAAGGAGYADTGAAAFGGADTIGPVADENKIGRGDGGGAGAWVG